MSEKNNNKIIQKLKNNKMPTATAAGRNAKKAKMNATSSNAAVPLFTEGNRRAKEKQAFIELSSLLPLAPPIRDQLDKTGTLRVSIAYLKLKRLFATFISTNGGAEFVGQSTSTTFNAVDCGDDQFGPLETVQKHWPPNRDAGFYGLGVVPTNCCCSKNGANGMGNNQQQEKQLAVMHQFAYNMFQAMDGFVIVLDGDGKVVYTSETVAVHLGLAQVELAGISLAEFLHPDDATLLRDQLALYLSARAFRVLQPELRFTLRFRCTPGRRAMLGCGSIGMQPGFKPIHFIGTLHADNDGRFLGYGQPSVPYGLNELRLCPSMFMFRSTPELQLIFVDNRFTELTELLPDFLLNKSLYLFIHPADVHQLREVQQTGTNQTALRGGHALSAFLRLLNARGGWHWIQCRLCTTSSTRLPSMAKMIVGVCSLISGVEQLNMVLDVLQLNNNNNNNNNGTASSNNGTIAGDGSGAKQNDNVTNDGVLGFYSNQFYMHERPSTAGAGDDVACCSSSSQH